MGSFPVRCAAWCLVMLMAGAGFVTESSARVGGSRSLGSRGSRSYSMPSPSRSYTPPASPQAPRPAYTPPPYQQPAGGGFFRNMAGGILGGMLGGMLFRSLGFGGGWGGGGGIGLFDIILIGGILWLIFRMVRGRRGQAASAGMPYHDRVEPAAWQPQQQYVAEPDDVDTGLAHIRQMDAGFDESRFCDGVMDMFFRIQGAWMNRDLAPVAGILTDEMRRILQEDAERLRREGRVNRLENIAVRNVDIVEAWQEQGQDFVTALIYANLLDYTTDDASGAVVSGSTTDPVKFEELWTFTRPVGNNAWRLSAIDQR